MACPYFFPAEPDPDRSPAAHAMLPLGDAWSGECHADPGRPWKPDTATLYPLCNIGYARARCPHFPAGDGPDAVRFSILPEEGPTLRVGYVVERDHLPYAHGAIEFCPPDAEFRPDPPIAAVARLARAYVASYLRRREAATR